MAESRRCYLKTSWGFKNKQKLVQLRNPLAERYVVVDTEVGRIVAHHPRKNTPYKGIQIHGQKGGD